MFVSGEILAKPLSILFVGYHEELLQITSRAFVIFSCAFLFSGIAIFGSSFFTALGDGLTSALISFLRTLVFECAAVIMLPIWWGLDGIWFSIVVAEVMAVAVTTLFLLGKRKKFGY
ncbi:MAG: MATE family efflux transporter, partial [Lachnospiraceae bacterium]|nr:MATE family efflux transporter [Lachnospiraceae bacterium]